MADESTRVADPVLRILSGPGTKHGAVVTNR